MLLKDNIQRLLHSVAINGCKCNEFFIISSHNPIITIWVQFEKGTQFFLFIKLTNWSRLEHFSNWKYLLTKGLFT